MCFTYVSFLEFEIFRLGKSEVGFFHNCLDGVGVLNERKWVAKFSKICTRGAPTIQFQTTSEVEGNEKTANVTCWVRRQVLGIRIFHPQTNVRNSESQI